jgi:alpha-aminoadipate/glutamate carrier protein LysW
MPNLQSTCPICDAQITIEEGAQESEIINCPDCSNRIVITAISDSAVTLEEAPEIEEDWGE